MSKTYFTKLSLVAGCSLFAMAAPAAAQDSATDPQTTTATTTATEADTETAPSEVIVTARRRAERLINVPMAVTALTSAQLEAAGALDITDIAQSSPNVTLETSRGTNSTLSAFIRGVGQQDPVAGFEQGVGIYLDDVYLNRPQAAVLDIYDVERVEVLRGPQGTLYGRNTIGGAVKYVSRRLASDLSGSMKVNLGTDGQADYIASLSTPVGSDAFRIGGAFASLTRDGFGTNLTTGRDNYNKDVLAARVSAELGRTDDALIRLSGDWTHDMSLERGGHRLIPAYFSNKPVLDNVFDSRGGLTRPVQDVLAKGANLTGQLRLNDMFMLKSISALRKDKSTTPIDFDVEASQDVDVPAIYENKQFSQEVQLLVESGRLSGVIGGYYLDADADTIFDVRIYTTAPTLPGLTATTSGNVKTKTYAAFADMTYDLSDRISLSVGGRYTDDKRTAKVLRETYILGGSALLGGGAPFGNGTKIATTSNFDGTRTDTAFTPRASVRFKPNADNTLFASISKGFKGGGFDPRGQTSQAPDSNKDGKVSYDEIYEFMAFDPEKVTSYEGGWKSSLMGGRAYLAASAFLANYRDVQVPGSSGCILNGVANFCGITTNAGKARFKGVELEGSAELFDGLTVSGNLGYLDAKYLEFLTNFAGVGAVDVAGSRKIQNTPKWTGALNAGYRTMMAGGTLNLSTGLSYRSASQQFELATPLLDQGAYTLWDAHAEWSDGHWTLGVHGKNLTDKEYVVSGYNFLAQNPTTGAFTVNPTTGRYVPTLGREGVLTAYYGNPRQVFVSLGYKF